MQYRTHNKASVGGVLYTFLFRIRLSEGENKNFGLEPWRGRKGTACDKTSFISPERDFTAGAFALKL